MRWENQPQLLDREVDAFFFNKSLQQRGLEWRLGELTSDLRGDIQSVGAVLVRQQRDAAARCDLARSEDRARSELLRQTMIDSAQAMERRLQDGFAATTAAIEQVGAAVSGQLTSIRWALEQQDTTLRGILDVLQTSRTNECRQLVTQGEAHRRAGFFAEARDRFRLALEQDSTDFLVHQNLGLVLVQTGELAAAAGHFHKAATFAPRHAPRLRATALVHLARACYAQQNYIESARALIEAVQLAPDDAKAWYDLAVMYTYCGTIAEGIPYALPPAARLDASFLGLALSDPELAPARSAVEAVAETLAREEGDALARDGAGFEQLDGLLRRAEGFVAADAVISRRRREARDLLRHARSHRTFPAAWQARRAIATVFADARSIVDALNRAIADGWRGDVDFQERKDAAIRQARATHVMAGISANARASRPLVGWLSRGDVRVANAAEEADIAAAGQRMDTDRAVLHARLQEMAQLRDAIRHATSRGGSPA